MLVHQWRCLDVKPVMGNLATAHGIREKTIGGQSQCKQQQNLIQAEEKHLSTVVAGILTGHLSFLSPREQTIATRISLKVATKAKSIGRAILVREYLRCLYRRHRDHWPYQAILFLLHVKHNWIKQNVYKLFRGKSNISNSSHLNKTL